MKINIDKKRILLIGAILIVIAIIVLMAKNAAHIQKIQESSTKQVSLYKDNLIPALMADFKDYRIENVLCNEIDTEGQCDYAIKIDCNLYIGQDKFDYPLIVLFSNNNEDNPKYQYNKDATDTINDSISKNQKKAQQDKITTDYIEINRKLLGNDGIAIPDAKISDSTTDNGNEKAYIITSSMIIPNHGLGTPKYYPIKMKLQYNKNGEYTFKYLKTN